MQRVKRFFCLILGLIGLLLLGITIFIILLQCRMEVNLPLSIFCIISWILFVFAVDQALLHDKEYNYVNSENSFCISKEIETEMPDSECKINYLLLENEGILKGEDTLS